MKITHAHLLAAGMPPWDVNKFRLLFPEGCEVTPENFRLAESRHLSPVAFFAAICPSKELMDQWHKYTSTDRAEDALRRECEAAIVKIRADAAQVELQRKCDLIVRAMQNLDGGKDSTCGDEGGGR